MPQEKLAYRGDEVVWAGPDGWCTGENWLGRVLMMARELLT